MKAPAPPLNDAQQRAVSHAGGPILVIAGAGSGKTRVLTHRIVELIQRQVPAGKILAVTFTNKAAQEMRHRVDQLLQQRYQFYSDSYLPVEPEIYKYRFAPNSDPNRPWVGTFHALGAYLLRGHPQVFGLTSGFTIADEVDQRALCNHILKDLKISDHINPRAVAAAIDQLKNSGQLDLKGHDPFSDIVARVFPVYQQRLRESGAVDFADLLLLPLQKTQTDPAWAQLLGQRFSYVLVDEFQDVNPMQYQLLTAIADQHHEIFAVGDDDQTIYTWRGADVKNLLGFSQDWPQAAIVKLEQNYRSTDIILQAANAVIAKSSARYDKVLHTQNSGGEPIVGFSAYHERHEAQWVAETIQTLMNQSAYLPQDFAVFYRTNAQSRVLEEQLRHRSIPYTVIGGTRFYDRSEIRDMLAYLRVCHNPDDLLALMRIINVPARGIGSVTWQRLQMYASTSNRGMWTALTQVDSQNLPKAGLQAVQEFVKLIQELQEIYQLHGLFALTEAIVARTQMLGFSQTTLEDLSRRENIFELLVSIKDLEKEKRLMGEKLNLSDYLEQVALLAGGDTKSVGVALMTVHAAKGLEFPVVFVTGLEEGLFPSLRWEQEWSPGPSPSLDEERRLAYVAFTRARQRLFVSHAQHRRLYGQAPRMNTPSRFLLDIPPSCLKQTVIPSEPMVNSWEVRKTAKIPYYRNFDEEIIQDTHIEYDTDEAPSWQQGQTVYHARFGAGQIRWVEDGGRKVRVHFAQAGEKTILPRYLSVVR